MIRFCLWETVTSLCSGQRFVGQTFTQCVGFSGESTVFVQAIIKVIMSVKASFRVEGWGVPWHASHTKDTDGYLLPHESNLTLPLLLPHHHLQNRFSPPRGSNLNPFVARWRKEREEQSCPALDVTLLSLKGWRKIWHGDFLRPAIIDSSCHFAWQAQPACLTGWLRSKRLGTLTATRRDLATLR